MSLLGRIGNIFHHDIVQPVQRDIVRPAQQVAQRAPQVNAQQLAQALQQHLVQPTQHLIAPQRPPNVPAPPQDPVSHLLGMLGRNFIAQPAAEIAATVLNKPIKPTNAVTKFALGKQTVKPVQQDVKGVYQAVKSGHQNLPIVNLPISPSLAAPYAAAAGVIHAANDLPLVGAAAKTAEKGVKVALPVAEDLAKNRALLNEAGGVGKYVSNIPEVLGHAPGGQKPNKLPSPTESKSPTQGVTPKIKTPPTEKGSVKLPEEFNQKVTAQLGGGTNPLVGQVKIPIVQAGDAGQAHLNAHFVAQHEQRVGKQAQNELTKLSPKDQDLMRQIQESGVQKTATKADNPTQFVKTEQSLRNYYNLRHAYDTELGIPTPYRKDYLRDLMPPQEPGGEFAATGGNLAPGYTKQKTAPGLTPVAEGLQRDIAGSSFNHAKLTYAKGLEEAFPEQISRGSPVVGPGGVTQQLTTPYGSELFATPHIAQGVNARTPVEKATGALGAYDKLNAFAKYIKLSGGAFHAFTEAGNFVGHQLASGRVFTEPQSTAKVFGTFFSNKLLAREGRALEANGTLDKARLGGLTWTPAEIKADVGTNPKNIIGKVTGLKALHDATFGRELPYIKMKIFEQNTRNLNPQIPADLQKIRQVANATNKAIGGVNRTVQGMTPRQAQLAARVLLATDFTEGKIRTVLSAVSKGGPEGKIARQIIAGKALVFAGLATGGAAATGELKGKTPEQVAKNILGNLVNPTFQSGKNTVSFPATHVSEFTKPFASFFDGSKDKFRGLKNYGTARLAAIPSEANQLVNNLDYSGQHIYGKSTKKTGGKPFTPEQTAVNVAKGILPIPFGQVTNTIQGKQSIPAAIGNIAGLRIAPTQNKTKPQTAAQKAALLNKQPDAEYKAAVARYNKQKKDGKLNQAQDIKAQDKLARLQVGSKFDKNVRDLYTLSKPEIYKFITTNGNGKAVADQLNQYDQALKNAGIISKLKFAKGFTPATSSGRRVGSRGRSTVKIAKAPIPKAYKPKKISPPKFSSKSSKPKKIAFGKYSAPRKPKAIQIA